MSACGPTTCRRTDAVLAVYLDGELAAAADRGRDTDRSREHHEDRVDEQWGYEFVSNDSLADHLRGCRSCQLALQRARRLDAVLASTTGRAVSEHVATAGIDLNRLADRWLQAAALAGRPAAGEPAAGHLVGHQAVADRVSGTRSGTAQLAMSDRANDHSRAEEQLSRPWTIAAAIGLVAAGIATWLCLTPNVAPPTHPNHVPDAGTTTPVENAASAHAGRQRVNRPAANQPAEAVQTQVLAEATLPAHTAEQPTATSLPPQLAGRLQAARQRDLPEQRSVAIEELGRRVADASCAASVRLAAAGRLLHTIGNGAVQRQHACNTLLAAVAGCGNRSTYESALHDELLDRMRACPALHAELESRLTVWSTYRFEQRPDRGLLAVGIVAARIGNDRLDVALRRAMREHAELCGVVAAGLRCGARLEGAAALLLGGWRDQVARGRQDDQMRWAGTWFAGQSPSTFAQLPILLTDTRSAADRVRCLLAMGCADDDTTVTTLLANLHSPSRDQALASACGLAALPHRVLVRLVPDAQHPAANLLRAALARAGLPAADAWLEPLALSTRQRQLLHHARFERFAEVVNWFRDRTGSAE